MDRSNDIKTNRLKSPEYTSRFCNKLDPLDPRQAMAEANRCFYCYDAPCIKACPTQIDVPSFIQKISSHNVRGAALDILNENIMGGTCARVCPVETLCENACVRNKNGEEPVAIALLQRYATDWLFERKIQPFARQARTKKTIAVIGAGPAGLSCAHRLATLGHEVEIFEAQSKAGGLNEFGLAAYKVEQDWVAREIAFILSVGGIKVHYAQILGKNIFFEDLLKKFDAVFISVGLSGVNSLGVEDEEIDGVEDATKFISQIRQIKDRADLPVGRRVIVLGGGNTAIDIAVQTKLLGAEEVTLVYRRGPQSMGATSKEKDFALKNGIQIRCWSRPKKVIGNSSGVIAVEFERTDLERDSENSFYTLPCDQLFRAIGQKLEINLAESIHIHDGRIVVDSERRTSVPRVYAGGDCIKGSGLTVAAVQDGKIAAHTIHRELTKEGAQRCNSGQSKIVTEKHEFDKPKVLPAFLTEILPETLPDLSLAETQEIPLP